MKLITSPMHIKKIMKNNLKLIRMQQVAFLTFCVVHLGR